MSVLLGLVACFASLVDAIGASLLEDPAYRAVVELLDGGQMLEAESRAAILFRETEARFGNHSSETASALDLWVKSLRMAGQVSDSSLALADRAIRLRESLNGPDSEEVARVLFNVGGLALAAGDFDAAHAAFARGLSILEQRLGPEHADLASYVHALAATLYRLGDLEAALGAVQRSLAIKEKSVGPDDRALVVSLDLQGSIQTTLGDRPAARRSYERALSIAEKTYGLDHERTSFSLANFGALLSEMGEIEESRRLLLRALAIRERSYGPENATVANALNLLGIVEQQCGNFDRARSYYERALAIDEKLLGAEHPDVARLLTDLADLDRELGDYGRALPRYQRALALREAMHAPGHHEVAEALISLAAFYIQIGDDGHAEPLCERAREIWEGIDPEHPYLVYPTQALAEIAHRKGHLEEAIRLFKHALALNEKGLGPESLDQAHLRGSIAVVLRERGDLRAAESEITRALEIEQRALGEESVRSARLLAERARIEARAGRIDTAIETTLRAEAIGRNHLRLTCRTLPERQALAFAAERASGLDLALALVANRASGSTASNGAGGNSAARATWDALVRSRALVLSAMAERHPTALAAEDTALTRPVSDYLEALRQQANLLVRGPEAASVGVFRAAYASAEQRTEVAERALLAKSDAFEADAALDRCGLDEVLAALPDSSALVAYTRYDNELGLPRYLAFSVTSEQREVLVFDLGEAGVLESLVAEWRREAGSPPSADNLPARVARVRAAGAALRARVWDPVSPAVGGSHRVFLVPDGALGLVHFAALPTGDDSYLVEQDPTMHLLSTERDVVAYAAELPLGSGLLALGDPDFDASLSNSRSDNTHASGRTSVLSVASLFRGAGPNCPEFQRLAWRRLHGTSGEIRSMEQLWKRAQRKRRGGGNAILLSGAEATETAFKSECSGRRILHLATHGFFLGDECLEAAAGSRGVGGYVVPGPVDSKPTTPLETGDIASAAAATLENPLHLSGIVLAGANQRESMRSDALDDGILTAEEVSALDLRGVEWAVVSACATGVGSVRQGEGILGLRRAFQVAGAHTLILSLWSVEDEATRAWMRALYEARLLEGRPTDEAVREACCKTLDAQRARGEGTHPFAWGAFVATGAWR